MPIYDDGCGYQSCESMLLQDFMRVLYKLVPVDDQYTHDLFELKRDSTSDGRSNGHSHRRPSSWNNLNDSGPKRVRLTDRQNIFAVEFDGSAQTWMS